jgi:hypothetical protein
MNHVKVEKNKTAGGRAGADERGGGAVMWGRASNVDWDKYDAGDRENEDGERAVTANAHEVQWTGNKRVDKTAV